MAYIVDGQHRFFNRWLALEYAISKNTRDVKFDMFNSIFAKQCWTKNPETSWESLCDIRCQQIKNKNRPIILFWSGGTDSYTVYNAFRRNNIKISAFVTKLRSDENLINGSVDWLKKTHNDPDTEFIIQDNNEIMQHNYVNKNFLIDSSCYHTFWVSTPDPFTTNLLKSKFDNPVMVFGFEKPRLLLENNNWYSIGIDSLFEAAMDPFSGIEMFFISPDLPELHVKQCWMLKTWIKGLNIAITENFVNHEVHDARKFDYQSFAKACGRDGDLSNSHIQKITSRNTKIIIDSEQLSRSYMVGRGAAIFNQGLIDRHPVVMNYIKSRRMVEEIRRVDPYWFNKDGSPVGIITDKFFMGTLKNAN
jgi:hypothetical protein